MGKLSENNEEEQKRIDNSLSLWQKTKSAFTPGDAKARAVREKQMADENAMLSNQAAQIEALKRRRQQGSK